MRLLYPLKNHRGEEFPAGTLLQVKGTWRGAFHLDLEANPPNQGVRTTSKTTGLRHIERARFEVHGEDY